MMRIARKTSSPDMRDKVISSFRQHHHDLGGVISKQTRPLQCPSAAVITVNPAVFNAFQATECTPSSSSATRTVLPPRHTSTPLKPSPDTGSGARKPGRDMERGRLAMLIVYADGTSMTSYNPQRSLPETCSHPCAVREDPGHVPSAALPDARRSRPDGRDAVAKLAGHQIVHGLSDHCIAVVAGRLLRLGVHADDLSVVIHHHHGM
jgi:hypothetical protein